MLKNEVKIMRFIKYMANLIHYNSVNFDKKRRVLANRYTLIPTNDEYPETKMLLSHDFITMTIDLKDHISDPSLFRAYTTLSEPQQRILSFAYVQRLNDREIAEVMGGTQQNISKQRLKALTKLRQLMLDQK